jgi:geranylgeranyl diphosphate synthase type I
MDFSKFQASYKKKFDSQLKKYVSTNKLAPMREIVQYHLFPGGKRMRPLLCNIACRAAGGNNSKKEEIAVELVHSFTLAHDDVMDHDYYRWKKESVYRKWGTPNAILLGDALLGMAFITVQAQARDVLSRAVVDVSRGQKLDMDMEKILGTSRDYVKMARLKTGALIRAAAMMGGIAGGASKKHLDALGRYGENIGLAFQIQDDYLDLVGGDVSDLKSVKPTMMMCHAYERSTRKERNQLTSGNVTKARKIIEKKKSVEYSKNYAKKLVAQAKRELVAFKPNKWTEVLIYLADKVVEREI